MGKLKCLPPYTHLRLFLLYKHRNSQLSNQSTYIGRSKNQPPKKKIHKKVEYIPFSQRDRGKTYIDRYLKGSAFCRH